MINCVDFLEDFVKPYAPILQGAYEKANIWPESERKFLILAEEIEESDYIETFNNFLDGYAFLIEKENQNYTFVFDGTDECTYTMIISASKDVCEWERFMNIEA